MHVYAERGAPHKLPHCHVRVGTVTCVVILPSLAPIHGELPRAILERLAARLDEVVAVWEKAQWLSVLSACPGRTSATPGSVRRPLTLARSSSPSPMAMSSTSISNTRFRALAMRSGISCMSNPMSSRSLPRTEMSLRFPGFDCGRLVIRIRESHLALEADNEARRVGRRLSALRKRSGLSSKALSERAGITPQSLSRIERGRHDVVFTTSSVCLPRWAKRLGPGA